MATCAERFDKRSEGPRTWGDIKRAIEAQGIKDDDPVWSLDLGPYVAPLEIQRDDLGIEITDNPTAMMG